MTFTKCSIIAMLLCASSILIAQEYELKDGQFHGTIDLGKGKSDEGIIEFKHADQPWSNQRSILFFKPEEVETTGKKGKVKRKEKERLTPKDIEGYTIGDRVFHKIQYTTAGNTAAQDVNTVTALSSGLKNAAKSKYFAELIQEGNISLYKFFDTPPDFAVMVGEEQSSEYSDMIDEIYNTYHVLLTRDEQPAKDLENLNIKKFFSDCSFVVDKYKDGQYTKKPVKGFKSALQQAFLSGQAAYDSVMEMINDYDANCKK